MGSGMFTAPRRVTRDGVLVCFEGERMTRDDAERRGLLTQAVSDPEARRAELMAMSARELAALAAEVGAEHAKGANKATVAEAIIRKEQV